jgi:hypothetical protein
MPQALVDFWTVHRIDVLVTAVFVVLIHLTTEGWAMLSKRFQKPDGDAVKK